MTAFTRALPLVVFIAKTPYRLADRGAALDPTLARWLPKTSEGRDRRNLSRPTRAIGSRKPKVRLAFLPAEAFESLAVRRESAMSKERVETAMFTLRHRDDVLVRVVLLVLINMMSGLPMLERSAKETLRNHAMEQTAVA